MSYRVNCAHRNRTWHSHNTIDIQYIDVYLLSTTLANSSLPQNNCVSWMCYRLTDCQRADSSRYCDCLWYGQCYVAFTTEGVCPVLLTYTHLRQFSRPALDRIPKAARCFWLFCSSLSAFIWRRENNNNNKTVNNERDMSSFVISCDFWRSNLKDLVVSGTEVGLNGNSKGSM